MDSQPFYYDEGQVCVEIKAVATRQPRKWTKSVILLILRR